MNYFEECLEQFNSLPQALREGFSSPAVVEKISQWEKEYGGIDLQFLLTLVAIGELDEDDIEEYIVKKYRLKNELAQKIKQKMVEEILDPVFGGFMVSPEVDLSTLEAKDARELINNIVSKDLLMTLKREPSYLKNLNILCFQAFNEDPLLEDRVIDLLYQNQEVLSTKPFVLEAKNQKSTIANWIKDFVTINGSDIFDAIVLSRYLSDSLNAKILDPEEKQLLNRVLKFYRNLVFFPESMEGVPVEDWQLFPIDKEIKENPLTALNPIISAPKVEITIPETEESIPVSEEPIEVASPESEPIITKERSESEKLQDLLAQYPAGSLEAKAIEAELRRVVNK